ncbi:STAS domain-containing protein [Streptomyces sp. HPF1205]|uniref:STAS domain-containing protein n=1 Tax=Streptomyces sp. HPF1205 TaxID=2873262 RepID=UPI001CECD1F4|nr:STAS domain-containing protein [Streptomyces sp. HPF1205]
MNPAPEPPACPPAGPAAGSPACPPPARGAEVVIDIRGLGGLPGPGGVWGSGGGLGAVAALARLRLAARRAGRRIRLRGASPEVRRMLELTGLAGEFEWEAEEGEQPGGVQE